MHYIFSRRVATLVLGFLVAGIATVSHATEVQPSQAAAKRKVSADDIKVMNLLLFEAKKNIRTNQSGFWERNLAQVAQLIRDLEGAGVRNLLVQEGDRDGAQRGPRGRGETPCEASGKPLGEPLSTPG